MDFIYNEILIQSSMTKKDNRTNYIGWYRLKQKSNINLLREKKSKAVCTI